MMACVSPELMVRSTPRRISLVPSSTSTETWRSRISSVVMVVSLSSVQVTGDGDEHVVAVDLHGVDGDRADRRGAGRVAGPNVEPGAVQPALEGAAVDLALGERDVGVGASVVERVVVAVAVADHRDDDTVDLGLRGAAGLQVTDVAHPRERVGHRLRAHEARPRSTSAPAR